MSKFNLTINLTKTQFTSLCAIPGFAEVLYDSLTGTESREPTEYNHSQSVIQSLVRDLQTTYPNDKIRQIQQLRLRVAEYPELSRHLIRLFPDQVGTGLITETHSDLMGAPYTTTKIGLAFAKKLVETDPDSIG